MAESTSPISHARPSGGGFGLFQVSALPIIARGAWMERKVANLGHPVAVVGEVPHAPLEQILLFVQRLGDEIGEILRHVRAAVYGGSAAGDSVDRRLLAPQQAGGDVAPL